MDIVYIRELEVRTIIIFDWGARAAAGSEPRSGDGVGHRYRCRH